MSVCVRYLTGHSNYKK